MKLKKCDAKEIKRVCKACGEPITKDWLQWIDEYSGNCRKCANFLRKCDLEYQDNIEDAGRCPECGHEMEKIFQIRDGYKNWIMSKCPNCGYIE